MDSIITMLDTVIIDNLKYNKGKTYKIPYWISKELANAGYCYYYIKPNEWLKENE